jgi:formylglycine-generating enzyme required for sulfatase activity
MERSGAQLSIIVLDACRDNPYHSSSRGGAGGLAAMNAARGTFIAFATSPGHTASDNPPGQNGLFTQYLLDALSVRGLGLDDVFNLVRERVDASSGGKQLPWTLSGVVGRYSFLPGEAGPEPPPAVDRAPHARDTKVNPADGQLYVWIPPGTFMMGCSAGDSECKDDEKPAHKVTITMGFWMGQTPVTVGAWKKLGKGLPPEPKSLDHELNPGWRDERQPIVNVTWGEAEEFCEAAGMRLPTEAEWEYAARAGSTGARYGNLGDIAWYADNSGRQRIDSTAIGKTDHKNYKQRLVDNGNGAKPVGKKQPNAFGLYDMLGNVWQRTADWYDATYYQASERQNPLGPPGGTYRTRRGGSWYNNPRLERASTRSKQEPGNRVYDSGLRCVGE